jgi:hypothetical protein
MAASITSRRVPVYAPGSLNPTSWLRLTTTSGPGIINVSADANITGAQRVGTLTVSGQTVTVTQAANNPLQIPALGGSACSRAPVQRT